MNAQNALEYLPLIHALANGRTIQENHFERWCDMRNPSFNMDVSFYRIKPEPRTFEIVRSKRCGSIYSKAGWDGSYPDNWERITVQEVLR